MTRRTVCRNRRRTGGTSRIATDRTTQPNAIFLCLHTPTRKHKKTPIHRCLCVFWWAMTGSNCRHPACKAGALPAELIAQLNWHGENPVKLIYKKVVCYNGDPYGIRTRVTAVKGRCLKPLDQGAVFFIYGGPTRDRTWDQPVMSRLLYR